MTFGEAAAIHLRNLDDNLRIKPSTRDYWRRRLLALIKSWPGLNETEVRKITQVDCKEWASAYGKKASPTTLQQHNRAVSGMFSTSQWKLACFTAIPQRL